MPAAPYDVPIAAVFDETPIDRTFTFRCPPGAVAAFRFRPGQFLTVSDPEDTVRPPRRRAYSISSSPGDGPIDGPSVVEVTVRDGGDFGGRFFRWPVGKVLSLLPPRGHFTLDDVVADDLLLTAGGSGVTPYRGFVRWLRAAGHARPVTLLCSARVPAELVFHEEFVRHARECPWFRYVPTVTRLGPEDPWAGLRGRLDVERLRPFVRAPEATTIYACGPNELVDAMVAAAHVLGIPPEKRRREKWG